MPPFPPRERFRRGPVRKGPDRPARTELYSDNTPDADWDAIMGEIPILYNVRTARSAAYRAQASKREEVRTEPEVRKDRKDRKVRKVRTEPEVGKVRKDPTDPEDRKEPPKDREDDGADYLPYAWMFSLTQKTFRRGCSRRRWVLTGDATGPGRGRWRCMVRIENAS